MSDEFFGGLDFGTSGVRISIIDIKNMTNKEKATKIECLKKKK